MLRGRIETQLAQDAKQPWQRFRLIKGHVLDALSRTVEERYSRPQSAALLLTELQADVHADTGWLWLHRLRKRFSQPSLDRVIRLV